MRNGPDRTAIKKAGDRDRLTRSTMAHLLVPAPFGSRAAVPCWHRRSVLHTTGDSAREMRTIAEQLTILPRAQESMLRIANEYERRAARFEEQ